MGQIKNIKLHIVTDIKSPKISTSRQDARTSGRNEALMGRHDGGD